MGHNHAVAMMILACVLSGCTKKTDVAELRSEMRGLETRIEGMRLWLKNVAERVENERPYDTYRYDVILRPANEGFSPIDTDIGRLALRLDDVQAYASGSKIVLEIGNLTSATIDGFRATIYWGSVDEKGSRKHDVARSREVETPLTFLPGTWTRVTLILDGVLPSEFGFVRVWGLTPTAIRLKSESIR